MVPCLHQYDIHIKRKLRVWRDWKCISLVGAKAALTCADRQTTPSQGRRYRAKNGNLRKLGGPIAMVPCLHQGNIYIKRKLRVWTDQKCIPLVGAKTPVTFAGHQSTPSQGRRYRAENENLRKLGWNYRLGTVFTPRQSLYQKEATGMERPEMYSTTWCKNPSNFCGPSIDPVSREAV